MEPLYNKIIEVIATKENVENPQWNYKYSSNKGDGYNGEIKAIDLEGSNGKKLDLIFKQAPINEKQRDSMTIRYKFVHEISFYEKVWPILRNFQLEYKVKEPFDNIPKCFATHSEPLKELLVLENITSSGYGLWNRKKLMDKEHLELVIKTYAKFQATVLALRTIRPNEYKKIKELLSCEGGDILTIFMEKIGIHYELEKLMLELSDIFDERTEKHHYERFRKFAKVATETCKKLETEKDYEVLCQGDAWCSNVMFLYGPDGNGENPLNAKIFDFQVIYGRSALLDLSYLFYANASKEAMDNLDQNLKLYHDTVADHLSKFNLDVNDVFPFDELLRLWPKYSQYGLAWTIFLRKGMLTESNEVPDFEKIAEEGGSTESSFSYKIKNDEEYRKQLKDIFSHAIDRNFL